MVVSPSDTNPYRLRSASWRHQRIGYRWILMQPGSGDPFTRASMLIATRENTHEHAAGPHDYPPWGSRGRRFKSCQPDFAKGQLSWPSTSGAVNGSPVLRHVILPVHAYGSKLSLIELPPAGSWCGSATAWWLFRARLSRRYDVNVSAFPARRFADDRPALLSIVDSRDTSVTRTLVRRSSGASAGVCPDRVTVGVWPIALPSVASLHR
jgi:hypothetical protein